MLATEFPDWALIGDIAVGVLVAWLVITLITLAAGAARRQP